MCNKGSRKIHALVRVRIYVSIHTRNLQILETEMYKVVHEITPTIVNEIFRVREESHYNLRQNSQFITPSVNTVNGTESANSTCCKDNLSNNGCPHSFFALYVKTEYNQRT